MPYLHLDLPGKFQTAQKRELAARLCRLYADVMQTQTWRPNIGIAELGEDNLFHLEADGLEPIVMVPLNSAPAVQANTGSSLRTVSLTRAWTS